MWFKNKAAKNNADEPARKKSDMRSELGINSGAPVAVRTRTPNKANVTQEVYDEEVQLHDMTVRARRRLIGALVLLAAAFIILPWVFDDERKQTASEVTVSVPDKNVQFEVKNPNANSVKSAPAAADNLTPPTASASTSSSATPTTEAVVKKPDGKPEPKTEVKPEPKPEPKAEVKPTNSQKYAVHIGLVTDGKELDALLTRLRAAGVEPQLKTVVVGGVSKTRVRLGLFDTQSDAEAAAKKARGAAKSPVVIPIKPE